MTRTHTVVVVADVLVLVANNDVGGCLALRAHDVFCPCFCSRAEFAFLYAIAILNVSIVMFEVSV